MRPINLDRVLAIVHANPTKMLSLSIVGSIRDHTGIRLVFRLIGKEEITPKYLTLSTALNLLVDTVYSKAAWRMRDDFQKRFGGFDRANDFVKCVVFDAHFIIHKTIKIYDPVSYDPRFGHEDGNGFLNVNESALIILLFFLIDCGFAHEDLAAIMSRRCSQNFELLYREYNSTK
jgi:hypothetical protein